MTGRASPTRAGATAGSAPGRTMTGTERRGSRTDRQIFSVDGSVHFIGHALDRAPRALRWLGDLETRMLADQLSVIDRPIYVAGLARAGSTLLLELLSWQRNVVTHQYRDFPLLHVPYLWNRFLDLAGTRTATAEERAHNDGVVVDRDSPEAFEEVLWMAFFPDLHQLGCCDVLDGRTQHPEFERFYRDHLRKLLLLRDGSRYVSKANYNVTRLEYLLRLFPDARFVIPVRDPVDHVASLMRQHERFSAGQRQDPRAREHLRRVGHFEFGIDRRAINTGDSSAVAAVEGCWESGREVEGWARYWAMVHDYLLRRLSENPALASATTIVPFETLCREPVGTIWQLLEHCELDVNAEALGRGAGHVRATGGQTSLDQGERRLVERFTRDTFQQLLALDSVVESVNESPAAELG